MQKNAKIYVAGHTGLVGSALVRQLVRLGYDNIVTANSQELDLRRQSETERFFQENRPDYVFLAAARVGGILANNTYKADFIYDNLAIAINVIQAAYRSGVKKLLNLGSSCIYPKHAPQPMREEHLLTGKLEPTNEPYAIAKIAAIKLCRFFNEQYGTNFMSVMPTNLYGPNDNFNLRNSHVLPAMIRKIHLAKLLRHGDYDAISKDMDHYPIGFGYDATYLKNDAGERSLEEILSPFGITRDYVLIWGTGEPYREFLHVDDLADACTFLMDKVDANDMRDISPDYFVNIGMGKDIRIKELAQEVKEVVGFKGEIKHDYSKPDGAPRKLLDVSKIKDLGWKPKTTLEKGILKTYEWYLTQPTKRTR